MGRVSDEGDPLVGEDVLTRHGPGYVETLDPGGLYVVDLHDSKRSFRMRRDEVEDAIAAHPSPRRCER